MADCHCGPWFLIQRLFEAANKLLLCWPRRFTRSVEICLVRCDLGQISKSHWLNPIKSSVRSHSSSIWVKVFLRLVDIPPGTWGLQGHHVGEDRIRFFLWPALVWPTSGHSHLTDRLVTLHQPDCRKRQDVWWALAVSVVCLKLSNDCNV